MIYEEFEDDKGRTGVEKRKGNLQIRIYAPFEDCFTKEELLQVLADLKLLIDSGINTPKIKDKFDKIKAKVKIKFKG